MNKKAYWANQPKPEDFDIDEWYKETPFRKYNKRRTDEEADADASDWYENQGVKELHGE